VANASMWQIRFMFVNTEAIFWMHGPNQRQKPLQSVANTTHKIKRSIPIEKRRVVGGVESEDETVEDDSQTGQDGDDLSPTMRR
jgi:hypothetical protein